MDLCCEGTGSHRLQVRKPCALRNVRCPSTLPATFTISMSETPPWDMGRVLARWNEARLSHNNSRDSSFSTLEHAEVLVLIAVLAPHGGSRVCCCPGRQRQHAGRDVPAQVHTTGPGCCCSLLLQLLHATLAAWGDWM